MEKTRLQVWHWNFCDFETNVIAKLFEHKFVVHPDIDTEFKPQAEAKNANEFILNLLAEQNLELIDEIQKLKEYIDKRLDKIEEKGDSGLKLINTKMETLQSNTKKNETEALPTSNPCHISNFSPNAQPIDLRLRLIF